MDPEELSVFGCGSTHLSASIRLRFIGQKLRRGDADRQSGSTPQKGKLFRVSSYQGCGSMRGVGLVRSLLQGTQCVIDR